MTVTLMIPAHIAWAQDKTCVWLVNEAENSVCALSGLEAAIWNWINLGYAYPRLVEMTAAYRAGSSAGAKRELTGILHQWLAQGWLEEAHV
jgi:hypothetical protein